MIHEILLEVVKERTTSDGRGTDEIDLRVAEMQSKEGMHVCPMCDTSMPKTKRKCVNRLWRQFEKCRKTSQRY